MNIEDIIYKKLTERDEYGENLGLRDMLFGDNEWSAIDQAEWIEQYENAHNYNEDMGS